MENEEVIRRQMAQTREALTEKLETLEQKVADSVTAVTDTVANVKDKVHEGVATVKEAVDVRVQVDRHPWLILGGSVVCGYVLGSMLPSRREPGLPPPMMPERVFGNGRHAQEKPEGAATGASWLSAFEPEIHHLKGLALGATLGTVREMLTEAVPPHMAEQLRDIIDAVTRKAGGEPIPKSDWAAIKAATPQNVQPEHSAF